MNFIILLIIIQFTRIAFCSYFNTSYNESFHTCTLSLFRRKRAPTEYTRWRANLEPTEQFIVKVFDDDITTPRSKQITAVNILPVRPKKEKILISGVRVPAHTAVTIKDTNNDYTRFVSLAKTNLINMDIIVSPQKSNKLSTIFPGNMNTKNVMVNYGSPPNSERDDSPPASPQFLTRTNDDHMVHQFAPISPVAFPRKPTLTSPVAQKEIVVTSKHKPTPTSPSVDNEVFPLRTYNSDALASLKYTISPQRTTVNRDISPESNNEINMKSNYGVKSNNEKDINPYGNMFYPDEDNESESTTKAIKAAYKENEISNENNDEPKEYNSNEYQEIYLGDSVESTSKFLSVETETDLDNQSNKFDPLITTLPSVPRFVLEERIHKRQSPCNILTKKTINLDSSQKLHEIVAQLKKWAEKSHMVKWTDITNGNYTNMENPIYMMIVDDMSKGQALSAKETVLIVAGIQGKDHYAVAAAMYLLHQLIETSGNYAELLTKYRFWVIPVFNPDGYDYSITFPKHRGWTKNLRQSWNTCKDSDCVSCDEYGISCTVQSCYGVNLDRNFEYQWIPMEELRTEHPCGPLYAGPRQLSEVETQALTQYLHEQRTSPIIFIAYKEGDVLGVMYPYSHTKKKRTLDYSNRIRASHAADAAFRAGGRAYAAGQTSEFLPLYAGGIDDWVDGHLGIDNTYTIMLFRPSDARDSSIPMERVVREAYAASQTLLLYKPEPLSPPLMNIKRTASRTLRPTSNNVIIATSVLLLGLG